MVEATSGRQCGGGTEATSDQEMSALQLSGENRARARLGAKARPQSDHWSPNRASRDNRPQVDREGVSRPAMEGLSWED